MRFKALKVCAGLHNFRPDQTIDLAEDEASVLMRAGAVHPIEAMDSEPDESHKLTRRNRRGRNAAETADGSGKQSGNDRAAS